MSGALPIQFDPASLITLNLIMAAMMFGVSLSLTLDDFKRILKAPVAPVAGLIAQFLLLPAATCLFTWLLNIDPELALGMMLVASCPGGSFSNVMTWLGRGNVAVSVSMTAVSSLAATLLTPLNFAFYGWLNPHTREYLTQISLDPTGILVIVLLVPASAPLIAMFMLGNLFRESKVVERLRDTTQNALMNIVTIFLGLSVGATMDAATFLRTDVLFIFALGLFAFALSTASGLLLAKLMNLFTKDKINPLVGAAGVSAVPMAARVVHKVGAEANKKNYLLMFAMGPNLAGVIGTVIAAGIFLTMLR